MSADILRRAAASARDNHAQGYADTDDAFLPALADWWEAEAQHMALTATKATAINVLLAVADNADEIQARISLGFETHTQAIATARAYLQES